MSWALAHHANEKDMCPGGCGQPISESAAMANGEPANSYFADSPIRCYACDELAKKQEAHADKGEVARPQALLWTVVKEQ